jgi:hypothetical protein
MRNSGFAGPHLPVLCRFTSSESGEEERFALVCPSELVQRGLGCPMYVVGEGVRPAYRRLMRNIAKARKVAAGPTEPDYPTRKLQQSKQHYLAVLEYTHLCLDVITVHLWLAVIVWKS